MITELSQKEKQYIMYFTIAILIAMFIAMLNFKSKSQYYEYMGNDDQDPKSEPMDQKTMMIVGGVALLCCCCCLSSIGILGFYLMNKK
jgi:hypothetical protein